MASIVAYAGAIKITTMCEMYKISVNTRYSEKNEQQFRGTAYS
jgi:hypothetical protein